MQKHAHRSSTSTTVDLVSLDSGSNSTTRMSDGGSGGKLEDPPSPMDNGPRNASGAQPAAFQERAGEGGALRPLEGWRLGGVTTA